MVSIARATLLLWTVATTVAADDLPDMASLPTLRVAGTLTASQMQHQAAWLQVDQAGLYSLTLDGPGLLGVTGFLTLDGRSDGRDPQRRLVQDGTAYRPGQLTDLLLEQGRAYLLQSGATQARAVTLTLLQPLDGSTALTADAMPGALTPWAITPGSAALLRPNRLTRLTLSAAASPPLRLQAIRPPDADTNPAYMGVELDPQGLFPLTGAADASLRVDGRKRLDGTFPLMLLRVSAMAGADSYDEREPGENMLGRCRRRDKSVAASCWPIPTAMTWSSAWSRPPCWT